MSLVAIQSSHSWCCPTVENPISCPRFRKTSLPNYWSTPRSNHSQISEPIERILSTPPRPPKRVRTGLNPNQLTSSSKTLEDDQLFAPGYPVPVIKIIPEDSVGTLIGRNSVDTCTIAPINASSIALKPGISPLSRFAAWILPRDPEDQELVVSPLETPSGFLEHIAKDTGDIENDPLGDIEMRTGGEYGEEFRESISPETSSYTLTRFLEDGTGSKRSIERELRQITSDLSDVLQGMKISDVDVPETHMRDLEASFGSENLEGLEGNTAECETDPQDNFEDENDIFSLEDGDEVVVAGPLEISPELESWISKSSLIVGRSLKPFVGGAVDSTGFPFHIPHGRKRKASTCQ
ncbi:hypothetical protein TWF481_001664 [Arthrobotrys musiformis]|uniref:Uncharacterized protein n=1 Tax=Arthrobotrys musiformis TaxID=47236 RepID=A0AAV9W014_9PEZI